MKDKIAYLLFDDCSEEELLSCINNDLTAGCRKTLVTPNLDGMRIAYKDKRVRDFINSSDYSTIDGKPILWIAKWLKKKQFKYKISGSDLTIKVLELASKNNNSVLIFGGKEGVADLAKANIQKKYPTIVDIYTICPEFGFEKNPKTVEKYIQCIKNCNADINLICLGFPKAELFFFPHINNFDAGIFMFVGGTVDFLAGTKKRAPKWMSEIGLEWLYRLSQDFIRLIGRYWSDFWFLFKLFFMIVFLKKWKL